MSGHLTAPLIHLRLVMVFTLSVVLRQLTPKNQIIFLSFFLLIPLIQIRINITIIPANFWSAILFGGVIIFLNSGLILIIMKLKSLISPFSVPTPTLILPVLFAPML